MILYLLIGLILGALIGYFASKISLQKNYVQKSELDHLHKEVSTLQIDNATRMTKEEVFKSYVTKDLYDSVNQRITDLTEDLQKEKGLNIEGQATILRLTVESEQKLSKETVDRDYVAKETFDIVKTKAVNAEIDLANNTQTILELNTQLTELREQEKHLNEKLTTFNTEIEQLHTLTKEQFKNLATDILEEKKKLFVETNKSEMNNILTPLKTDLTNFKTTIENTRKEDIQDLTSLKNEIESLQKLNIQLSDDAQNLAHALKSEVKVQGNWGEGRLNVILETEGLQKYIDYKSQGSYRDEDKEVDRKPDFIINLPNGKHLIIDSKVSLTAYVNYFNAANPTEKAEYLKLHLKSLIDHIDKLADKHYQSLAGLNTPDYVFLFMPIEGALTLALNESQDIFDRALKKKIIIITPTTLVATLKIVKILWQKENQVKNVEEIFKQCGLLYDKFVLFLEEMEKLGTGLNGANKAFKDAMDNLKDGTRKGNTIIGRFETIKNLEAKTNKTIPDKYIAEIELLGEDNEIKALELGNEKTSGTNSNS